MMRTHEQIKSELEYILSTEDRRPQDATFDSITAELMLDCRTLLQVLVEVSGVQLWGDDSKSESDSDSS